MCAASICTDVLGWSRSSRHSLTRSLPCTMTGWPFWRDRATFAARTWKAQTP